MVEAATAAAARIPSARLIRIPDVDHLPQVRVPDLVVTTIRQHCIDLDRTPETGLLRPDS